MSRIRAEKRLLFFAASRVMVRTIGMSKYSTLRPMAKAISFSVSFCINASEYLIIPWRRLAGPLSGVPSYNVVGWVDRKAAV